MKSPPPALLAHLAGTTTRLATCVRITRADGVVLGMTDAAADILVAGVTYASSVGHTPTAVSTSAGLAVANLEIDAALDAVGVTEADLRAGRYDGARVEVFLCDWRNPADGIVTLRRGRCGEAQARGGAVVLEIRGLAQPLSQSIVRLYAPGCDATFGDSRCGVDAAAWTASGTVATVVDARRFTDPALAGFGDGYFRGGLITFTSGANAGRAVEIASHTAATVETVLALPDAIAPGDTFTARAGCDKTFATCTGTFANAANFRGFPHVPGNANAKAYSVQRDAEVSGGGGWGAFLGQIVTATIGYMVGGPLGAQIGWVAGALLFPPQQPDHHGPRISDRQVQSSAYGEAVPRVYGTVALAGNIVWARDIAEEAHTREVEQGGPGGFVSDLIGGGGGQQVTEYFYFADFAVAIADGPVAAVRRIWLDHTLVHDARETNLGGIGTDLVLSTAAAGPAKVVTVAGTHGSGTIACYLGTETQAPDADLEAAEGAGLVPGYRGTVLLVFQHLPLENYGNRIPTVRVELVRPGTADALALTAFTTPPSTTNPTDQQIGSALWDPVTASLLTFRGNADDAPFGFRVASLDPVSGAARWSVEIGASIARSPIALDTRRARLYVCPEGFTAHRIDLHSGALSASLIAADLGTYSYLALYVPTADELWFPGLGPTIGTSGGDPVRSKVRIHDAETLEFLRWLSHDTYLASATYVPATDEVWLSNGVRCDRFGVPVGATPVTGAAFRYDDKRRCVWATGWAANTFTARRIDPVTCAIVWSASYSTSGQPQPVSIATDDARNEVLMPLGATLRRYDAATGTYLGAWALSAGSITGVVADPTRGALWLQPYGNLSQYRAPLYRVPATPDTLAHAVGDLAALAGFDVADLDVSALTGLDVQGAIIGRRMTARAAIEPFQSAHLFDLVDAGDQLRAVVRGGAAVATVPYTQLGARETGTEPVEPWQLTRAQSIELPREVAVTYLSREADYETGTQIAQRILTDSDDRRQVEMSLVLTDAQARRAAEVALYVAWAQREKYEFSLPRPWLTLEPGDALLLEDAAGHTRRVLVQRTDIGRPGLVRVEALADDAALYDLLPAAAPMRAPVSHTDLGDTGRSHLVLRNLPMLADSHPQGGAYAAATGSAAGWRGANLWRSSDSGATWRLARRLPEAALGTATTALPVGGVATWDDVSTLDVTFARPVTLTSRTDLAVLNGANVAVVGDEVIQFVTATALGGNAWRLSRLLRGRRGTEHTVGTHAVGDAVLVLDAAVAALGLTTADLGAVRHYKAPPLGVALDAVDPVPFRATGRGLMPYAPVHLAGARDGGGDLVITWVRRTRIGGDLIDYVDAPLGEAVEAYELDVLSGAGAVLRTLTTGTPAATYTAAQQTADFGAPQAAVAVRVYQMSATVGRGLPGAATL